MVFTTFPSTSILLVVSEGERNNQNQNTVTFQCGTEASSSLKRNKWGAARRGNVYAGFELEPAGAQR